jgi:hypothetical protein
MDELISLGALLISIVAFLYTYISNTKKYELYSQYKNEILSWYKETNEILKMLQIEAENNFKNEALKNELLAKLSSNIDYGRFYFPNLKNNYREDKGPAYSGFRNIILDFLVFTYRLYKDNDYNKYPNHAQQLQKLFTSAIFEVVNPHEFKLKTKKLTNNDFYINKSYDDVLLETKEFYSLFNK